MVDVVQMLDTLSLLNRPLPNPNPHPVGDCNTGLIIIELCNGLDDNCNGLVDEGDSCASRDTTCVCQRTTCAQQGVTCGTTHDGCDQILVCGGPCQ